MKPMCSCTLAFLSIKQAHFLPIFGRKLFCGPKEKTSGFTIYFSSFSPNQTHSEQIFFPIFSPKFSIHSILPLSKHNISKIILKRR